MGTETTATVVNYSPVLFVDTSLFDYFDNFYRNHILRCNLSSVLVYFILVSVIFVIAVVLNEYQFRDELTIYRLTKSSRNDSKLSPSLDDAVERENETTRINTLSTSIFECKPVSSGSSSTDLHMLTNTNTGYSVYIGPQCSVFIQQLSLQTQLS